MTQAQAIATHRVRIFLTGLGTAGSAWACIVKAAPAVPLAIVQVVETRTHTDFVFDQVMTPGASYVLKGGGNSYPFRGYRSAQLVARQLEALPLMPAYVRAADEDGDQRDFFACLQDVVDHLTMQMEALGTDLSPQTARATAVQGMLSDLGCPFGFMRTTDDARRLVPLLVQLYRQKGTPRGIRNAVRLFLGIELSEVRPRRRTADAARSDLYTFDVILPRHISDDERKIAHHIITYMKPAHERLGQILPN